MKRIMWAVRKLAHVQRRYILNLPVDIVRKMGFQGGDDLLIECDGNTITITKNINKKEGI